MSNSLNVGQYELWFMRGPCRLSGVITPPLGRLSEVFTPSIGRLSEIFTPSLCRLSGVFTPIVVYCTIIIIINNLDLYSTFSSRSSKALYRR